MTEIKPCPFCGGFAGMLRVHVVFYVGCLNENCMARGPGLLSHDEATLAWNTRVDDFSDWPDAPLVNEVDTQMDCEFDLGDDRVANISLPHDLTEEEARSLLEEIGVYMENWFFGV